MDIQLRRVFLILLASTSLLIIPAIATQVSKEVDWQLGDFVVAWLLVSALGLSGYFVHLKFGQSKAKWALWSLFLMAFVILWIQLAVGIF